LICFFFEKQLLDKNVYNHAAHVFIWARNESKLWNFDLNASILMQLRFDGFIGFPGGFVDPTDLSIESGLNRELNEELNINNKKYVLAKNNHFFSTLNSEKKMVLHFYTFEVSTESFREIELDSMHSQDYGGEVMGIIRPPLFETNRERGFSIFISHQFIGNALVQFLKAIIYLNIMPKQSIINAINSHNSKL